MPVELWEKGEERNWLVELLDRGNGRPIQAVDLIRMGKKLSELSTEELTARNARLVSSGAVGAGQPPDEEPLH